MKWWQIYWKKTLVNSHFCMKIIECWPLINCKKVVKSMLFPLFNSLFCIVDLNLYKMLCLNLSLKKRKKKRKKKKMMKNKKMLIKMNKKVSKTLIVRIKLKRKVEKRIQKWIEIIKQVDWMFDILNSSLILNSKFT